MTDGYHETTNTMSKPIILQQVDKTFIITLNRPEAKNSLSAELIEALRNALAEAASNANIRCIALFGNSEHFCTGMDFQEAIQTQHQTVAERETWNAHYIELLNTLSNIPKVTIACIEGVVVAGGMGLVSACDLVIAHEGARFSLSEALWGLLPAMVLPYMIRRTGFQPAYRLTLTTESITATEAERIHLVDIVSHNIMQALKIYERRCYRLAQETLLDFKRYLRSLAPISETIQTKAIQETARLAAEPRIQQNITNFLHHQQFPWE